MRSVLTECFPIKERALGIGVRFKGSATGEVPLPELRRSLEPFGGSQINQFDEIRRVDRLRIDPGFGCVLCHIEPL